MNILNFFNTTKMHGIHADFKRFLKLLTPEEQLIEINRVINKLNKSNRQVIRFQKDFTY